MELLQAIAEAGVRAPSARNMRPWHLVVITTKATMDEISSCGKEQFRLTDEAAYDRVMQRGGTLLYNAPAMIIVAASPDDPFDYAKTDTGIVVSHLALAATSLGLDTCVVGMPRAAFQDGAVGDLKAKYLPEGYTFAIAVLLGYAETPGGTPHEPALSQITYV